MLRNLKGLGDRRQFCTLIRYLDNAVLGQRLQFDESYTNRVMRVFAVDLRLLANPIIKENERLDVSLERLN